MKFFLIVILMKLEYMKFVNKAIDKEFELI